MNRDGLDKLVDLEAEEIVIGSAFDGGSGWFETAFDLQPDEFYDPRHAQIVDALHHHVRSGLPLELTAVGGTLRDRGAAAGLFQKLAEAADRYMGEEQRLTFYADRVRHLAHQRRVYRSLCRCTQIIVDPELDYRERIDAVSETVFSGLEPRRSSGLGTAEKLASEVEAIACDAREAHLRGDVVASVGTGFPKIDAVTGGLQPGRLVIYAARSSYGKSTLAQDTAHAAAAAGHGVLYVALEATRREVFLSILQKRSGLRPADVLAGTVDPEALSSFLDEMRTLPLTIESDRFPLPRLSALIRRARVVRHVQLVIVDYLQLVENRMKGQSRATEVAGVSAELKALAMEHGICVIAAAQLNKGPEEREDGKPRLRDLRESEAIAHDADQVIFLVRPDLAGGGRPYVCVAKNRHGPVEAQIPLEYEPGRNRYREPGLRVVA